MDWQAIFHDRIQIVTEHMRVCQLFINAAEMYSSNTTLWFYPIKVLDTFLVLLQGSILLEVFFVFKLM